MSEDKIAEFCAITGSDASTAKALLEACAGDLPMAINMHMEEDNNTSASHSNSNGSRKRKADEDSDDDGVRAPIPQKQETLLGAGFEDGYTQEQRGRRMQRARNQRVRTVFDGFRNFGKEAGTTYAGASNSGGASSSSTSSSNGGGASKRKKQTLEDLFKPPLDLLFKGDWMAAKDSAEVNKKWLLVNIQDSREFACQMLNRDVWSSQLVKDTVRENFIFWQQYKETEDAERYMRFYPVHEWPHVAVLDPRTGEHLVTWNKIADANVFSDLVAAFLSEHPSLDDSGSQIKNKKEGDKKDDVLNLDEDDQLAAAIAASLAESSKSEPAAPTKDGSESELEFEEDDSCQSWAKSGANSRAISPEPVKKKSGGSHEVEDWKKYLGAEGDPPTTLSIRFPDGERETKTLPSSSSFKAVVLYTHSKGFSPSEHEIVTNFPRRVLTDEPDTKTLQELDLCPRSAIFVQKT